jgi:hypothetical protein
MPSLDHPRLRAWDICPLCAGHKSRGLVACWDCFNERDPVEAEQIFDRAERALLVAARRGIEHITPRAVRPVITRVGLVDGKRQPYPILGRRS